MRAIVSELGRERGRDSRDSAPLHPEPSCRLHRHPGHALRPQRRAQHGRRRRRGPAGRTRSSALHGPPLGSQLPAMSMAPISRPVRPASPVMAPTRSCGRTPASRPAPTKRRVIAGRGPPGAGRPRARPARSRGRAAAVAVRRARPRGSRPRRPRRAPLGLVGQLHRRQRDVHDVELLGQRLDDDAEAVEVAAERSPRGARPA